METPMPLKVDFTQKQLSDPSKSLTPGESGQPKPRLSERRYTPTLDSLEIQSSNQEIGQTIFQSIIEAELYKKPCQKLLTYSLQPSALKSIKMPKNLKPDRESLSPTGAEPPPELSNSCLKSNLKVPTVHNTKKTVSFCSEIQLEESHTFSSPASVVYIGDISMEEDLGSSQDWESWKADKEEKEEKSASTTISTQGNTDAPDQSIVFEGKSESFAYENGVAINLPPKPQEFGENPVVAFCSQCEREVVTVVIYESEKVSMMGKVGNWLLCCVQGSLFTNLQMVHRCSQCQFALAKFSVQQINEQVQV